MREPVTSCHSHWGRGDRGGWGPTVARPKKLMQQRWGPRPRSREIFHPVTLPHRSRTWNRATRWAPNPTATYLATTSTGLPRQQGANLALAALCLVPLPRYEPPCQFPSLDGRACPQLPTPSANRGSKELGKGDAGASNCNKNTSRSGTIRTVGSVNPNRAGVQGAASPWRGTWGCPPRTIHSPLPQHMREPVTPCHSHWGRGDRGGWGPTVARPKKLMQQRWDLPKLRSGSIF
jgi:hypothetical protein